MLFATILSGIVLFILIAVALLPSKTHVMRSIEIDAPIEKAFELVVNLEKWPSWSPWFKLDPNMQVTYSDKKQGLGASYSWKSNHKHVGIGKITLVEVVPNKKTVSKLEFEGWGENSSTMHFEDQGNQSKVSWEMTNEFKGGMKIMGLIMKGKLSRQFDEGLEAIKTIAEGN